MSVLSQGNRLQLLSLGSCLIPSLSDVDDGARDRVFAVIEATLAARRPKGSQSSSRIAGGMTGCGPEMVPSVDLFWERLSN
jgi:hypothetical protein